MAIDASPAATLLVEDSGRIALENPLAQTLFGRSVVGLAVEDLVPADRMVRHRELRQGWLANPRARLMGRGRDLMAVRADGSTVAVEVGIQAFEREGRTWTICWLVDVSSRRRLEADRDAAWAHALRSQRLEGMGLLAGGVAHDFNNLLVGVIGNANLALGVLQPGTPAHDYVQDLLRAAMQASSLAKQMLTYSGRGPHRVDVLDLSSLVGDLRDLLRSSVPRHIGLRVTCDADLPPLTGDANQLRQVLLNLVTNAAESIETTGTIGVHTCLLPMSAPELAEARPHALPSGPWLALVVTDDGVGMAPDVAERVFDPFYTTKPAGHGLGMATVLDIVRAHRGGVHVRSSAGAGTRITVFLPPHRPPSPTVEDSPRRTGTVLLADDEPIVRRMARRVLVGAGYAVIEAEDGRQALELFRERSAEIDALLLDASMPHLNGADVFEAVRALRPDVPVLLSSGFHETEATTRLQGQGLSGFLQKPYTPDDLLVMLGRALARAPTS
ncbi:MAG: response regulator [Alphaproteobacteria bacterium]|nr:response regulator [Alphaproteobacteria bacterium]MCB9688291.1 response regulator [Alphaproteobacteria bacterium]MCB9697503.1 response regulator [Alphaproteobacteria bacterium]